MSSQNFKRTNTISVIPSLYFAQGLVPFFADQYPRAVCIAARVASSDNSTIALLDRHGFGFYSLFKRLRGPFWNWIFRANQFVRHLL